MKKIKIAVKDNSLSLLNNIELIAGTVGQQCIFFFDDEWALLKKTISYKVGSTVLGSYKMTSDEIIIPAHILATAGLSLEIGITGYSHDNSLVIPTSWCYISKIKNGSSTSLPTEDNPEGDDDDGDQIHIVYDGGVIA